MGGASGAAAVGRPRSKTFAEYEKDTTDAWGDEEEEDTQLSVPSELENELKQQHSEASSDTGAAPSRRRASKGKGEKNSRPPSVRGAAPLPSLR